MEGGWLEINVNEAAVIGIVLIHWISFYFLIFFLCIEHDMRKSAHDKSTLAQFNRPIPHMIL